MNRTAAIRRVINCVIADCSNSQAIPSSIERDRRTENIISLQGCHIYASPAGVALTNSSLLRPSREGCICEAEEMNSAAIRCNITEAIIPHGTHGKQASRSVERDRLAEHVIWLQVCHIDVLAAGVAASNHPLQRTSREGNVRKAKQIYCADISRPWRRRNAKPTITRGPDGQAISRSIERDRFAKIIVIFESGYVNVFPAGVALADRPLQGTPRE